MKTIAANDRQPATSQAHLDTKSAGGSRVMDSLCNSVTLSLIEAPWWIAMLTLVFSGPLANYLGQASIYLIAGAVVSMTIVSFFSSWKGVIWIPQDVPTAIIVLITGKMLSDMPDTISMDSQFATVIIAIGSVQWSLIFAQMPHMLILVAASVVSMLLNNSGFELYVGGKFDHDKDLRTTGIANLLAGLVGGWPGYMSPAWSSLNTKQGRQLPFTGILVAVLSGLILWCASDFLAYIPRFVIGSAVAYVGVCFLFDWVIRPAKRLSWGEFAGLVGFGV
ncbi:SulP family inorganic anion transporter [Leucothrix mucor]|uniref:SulP family inorganic anion transporter n=1 Tax=Leucothrix mucor TaxID=45248 RepID=UPI0003B4B668|nr:SulP family inorganic anion transporter [Leucothrix mucor]